VSQVITVATIHGFDISNLHPRLHFCKRYCSAFLEKKQQQQMKTNLHNRYKYKRRFNTLELTLLLSLVILLLALFRNDSHRIGMIVIYKTPTL